MFIRSRPAAFGRNQEEALGACLDVLGCHANGPGLIVTGSQGVAGLGIGAFGFGSQGPRLSRRSSCDALQRAVNLQTTRPQIQYPWQGILKQC